MWIKFSTLFCTTDNVVDSGLWIVKILSQLTICFHWTEVSESRRNHKMWPFSAFFTLHSSFFFIHFLIFVDVNQFFILLLHFVKELFWKKGTYASVRTWKYFSLILQFFLVFNNEEVQGKRQEKNVNRGEF